MTTTPNFDDETAARLARRPWPATPLHPKVRVSFEFFPPATSKGEESLAACAAQLAPLQPSFASVTYGAGGTTQDRTQAAVERLVAETDLAVAGHLTCVGATQSDLAPVIENYLASGVRHIVALRGDAPVGGSDEPVPGGYRDAAELVAGLRSHVEGTDAEDLQISVGAYPEVHPKATSPRASCRSRTSATSAVSPSAVARTFPAGCTTCSLASTTLRRCTRWLPQLSLPNSAAVSPSMA